MLSLNSFQLKKETFSFSICGSGVWDLMLGVTLADQALARSSVTDRWGRPHLWRLAPWRLITITDRVRAGMRPPCAPPPPPPAVGLSQQGRLLVFNFSQFFFSLLAFCFSTSWKRRQNIRSALIVSYQLIAQLSERRGACVDSGRIWGRNIS